MVLCPKKKTVSELRHHGARSQSAPRAFLFAFSSFFALFRPAPRSAFPPCKIRFTLKRNNFYLPCPHFLSKNVYILATIKGTDGILVPPDWWKNQAMGGKKT